MKKGLIVLLGILSVLCFAGGAIGYMEANKTKPDVPSDNKDKIKYVYYLDGTLVTKELVSNKKSYIDATSSSLVETTTNDIVFTNSSCTNNLTGTFDTNTWEFVPSEEKVSTCSLYFNRANYDVTLTVTGGEVDANQDTKVAREKNGIFKIKPHEGYEFDSVICSNNKEASWDKDNNVLSINAITEDVACKVVFKIKSLTFKLKAENGTGDNQLTVEYGKNISSLATPNKDYEFASNAKITCTNNQVATYDQSKSVVVIDKLTDNTECTIKFTPVKVEKFKVSLTMPEHVKVTKGSTSQEVNKNATAEFTLKADTGYELVKMDCDGTEPAKTVNSADNSVTYKIPNVIKNMTCTVTEKVVSASGN